MKYNKTFKRKIDQHFKFLIDPSLTCICENQDDVVKHYSARGGAGPKLAKYDKIHHCPSRKLYKPCLCD